VIRTTPYEGKIVEVYPHSWILESRVIKTDRKWERNRATFESSYVGAAKYAPTRLYPFYLPFHLLTLAIAVNPCR